MSKTATIETIEASATEIFCRDGYDGASMRAIAQHANVSLGAIHQYFETKSGLYIRVAQRLFQSLEEERLSILTQMRDEGRVIDLKAILYCLAAPLLAKTDDERAAWTPSRLSAWYSTTEHLSGYPAFRDQLRGATENWARLICETQPGLDFERALLAYATVHSALLNWQSTLRYLYCTLGLAQEPTPQVSCEHFIAMMEHGIRALSAPQ